MTQLRFKKLWIVIGLLWLPFLPQVPGCTMANMPKGGRIVDATTGKGMSDVTVIAAAHFFSQAAFSSNAYSPYRIITHTNSNGYYWIPSTWAYLAFAFPWQEPRLTWVVTAFKPDYAIVGDEKAWSEFDKFGAPVYLPRSTGVSPPALWLGWIVKVDPIQMQQVQLGLKEAAVYYRSIIITGRVEHPEEPEEIQLRKHAYQDLLPRVCSEDSNVEFDYSTLSGLTSIVPNRREFLARSKLFVPDIWPKEIYAHPKYRAGEVCEAMKVGGAP